MTADASLTDELHVNGHFDIRCLDNQGNVLWQEGFDNIVPTVGLNQMLAAGITSVATFMGLISSIGLGTLNAADTMTSHAGWNEAQNTGTNTPPYGTVRPTITWSVPAGGIVNAGTSTFVFTNGGTIAGGFLATGAGASAVVANTGGVLLSEGLLATPQPVISGNTFQMTYTLTV